MIAYRLTVTQGIFRCDKLISKTMLESAYAPLMILAEIANTMDYELLKIAGVVHPNREWTIRSIDLVTDRRQND